MPRALKVCSVVGCPNLATPPASRCPTHTRQAEVRRGSARQRGYDRRHEIRFRRPVLRRDPLCVCPDRTHGHGSECLSMSTVADHHPRTRDELVRLGLDANNPKHGRGLCKTCHDKHTAATSPGGWHNQ